MGEQAVLDGGFADPVFGAQSSFRALMDALANPGLAQPLVAAEHPAGLASELAAVALTVCDHDSDVWLDPTLASDPAVVAWLRFQTGAPLVTDPAQAQFALVSDAAMLPALSHFALGSDEYPDRSTTIALMVASLEGGPALTLRGPGIKDTRTIAPAGLPDGFLVQWADNRALFPRGVDVLLLSGGQVIGLPRTTRISTEG
jgi:alpha-D-ribose 1-methylphosphonate 5-triphosphate synthase subunit PhnH